MVAIRRMSTALRGMAARCMAGVLMAGCRMIGVLMARLGVLPAIATRMSAGACMMRGSRVRSARRVLTT